MVHPLLEGSHTSDPQGVDGFVGPPTNKNAGGPRGGSRPGSVDLCPPSLPSPGRSQLSKGGGNLLGSGGQNCPKNNPSLVHELSNLGPIRPAWTPNCRS